MIGAPNTLAAINAEDTANVAAGALPPVPSMGAMAAPVSAAPAPQMPPAQAPQQGPNIGNALKQLLPLLISGIVAKQGGAKAGTAVLDGVAEGTEALNKTRMEQAKAEALLGQNAEKLRLDAAKDKQDREYKLANYIAEITKTAATIEDAAAFAQTVELADSTAQRVFGAPAGYIKNQLTFQGEKKKADKDKAAAVAIMADLEKRYGKDDPEWLPKLIQSGATIGGRPLSEIAALTNYEVRDSKGGLLTPSADSGEITPDTEKTFIAAKIAEARKAARAAGKPFTQADAIAISTKARSEWMGAGRDNDPVLDEMRRLRLEQARNVNSGRQLTPAQEAQANRLGDDYTRDSKDFVVRAQTYSTMLSADATAAGDLSLIFAYMKMLDPGSVVREQEFANAQNAAGVPDRIRNMYNKMLTGERLNPNQRQDFLQQAKNIYGGAKQRQDAIVRQYTRRAQISKVPPEMVIIDFSEGLTPPNAKDGPAVGERRTINGQLAEWDGKGWKAVK